MAVVGGFDDTELHRVFAGHRNGCDRHLGVPPLMKLDHAGDVHRVDMVAAENGHYVGAGLFYQIDVLIDGIGSSLIPGFAVRAHLCRNGNDELILQQTAELPALTEMLQERLAPELGQDIDGVDAGIDEIAEDEVDDAVLAAKRDRGFSALAGEWIEAGALTA